MQWFMNDLQKLRIIIIITILKNIPVWSPSEAKGGDVKVEDPEGKMTLAKFDVKHLWRMNGQFLMSSEGKEVDVEKSEFNGVNSKLRQREKLNKELSVRSLVLTSWVSNRIIDEEDLNDHQQETVNDKKFASEILVQWKKSNLSLVKTASALER